MNIEEIFRGDRKKYMQIIRLLSLIEGTNESIHLSRKMQSPLEEKQYLHLKKQYAENLIRLLKSYDIPLQIA